MIRSRYLVGLVQKAVELTAVPKSDGIVIHGVPDAAAREASVRVRSALAAQGLCLGAEVTIAPFPTVAVPHLDLPIALAVLQAHGHDVPEVLAMGELALSGDVRPMRGLTPLLARGEFERDGGQVLVPLQNEAEAAQHGRHARLVGSLQELVTGLATGFDPTCLARPMKPAPSETTKGSPLGVVLVGARGSGKTLIARCLAEAVGFERDAAVDCIYSIAGLLPPGGTVSRTPFRAPHHTVSEAGLTGTSSRPGEVSLAHRGVLFLDELTEFRLGALEALFEVVRVGHNRPGGSPPGFPARPALVIGASENTPRLSKLVDRFRLQVIPIAEHFALADAIQQARRS